MSNAKTEGVLEVSAADLLAELTQDTPEQDTGKKPILPLHRARVWGELDVKHLTIDRPLEIRN